MYSRAVCIAVVAITAMTSLTNGARTVSFGPHHSFLGGPWELVVKMGRQGQALHFPVTVSDENKPHKFDNVLPVMGTPIKIRLDQYVPDLKWETTAVQHHGAGIVAKLAVKGKNLEQEIWLSSGDPLRQSMSSRIGGVAIRRLHDPNTVEKLLRKLTDPKAVGILSIWLDDPNSPLEYIAYPSKTITLPKSRYKVKVLDYIPHYSIDTKTKKVTSLSDKPVNPVVKVSVNDGENTYEQWLWAKFPSFPHKQKKLPLRMRFSEFDLSGTEGRYFLVVAHGSEPWLLFSRKRKTRAEKAVFGRPYPFTDKEYSFVIEKIVDGAIIKREWKNNSENLLRPAIIVTIEQNSVSQQAVLEFNKPYHYKTKFGTMVLLYRRRPEASKASD